MGKREERDKQRKENEPSEAQYTCTLDHELVVYLFGREYNSCYVFPPGYVWF